MAIEYFNSYHSYLKAIEPLNDAERGRLYTACLEYSMTGVAPELKGNERFVFPSMAAQIDRDKAKYAERCRKNAENISKRWNTTEYDGKNRIRTDTKHTKAKEKAKEKANIGGSPLDPPADKSPCAPAKQLKRFVPPTVEEVRSYCAERHNRIDPQQFVDFYTANGWTQGHGKKLTDWRAAVRTWEGRDRSRSPGRNAAPPSDADYDLSRFLGG